MTLREPLRPFASTEFSGWRIVAIASVVLGMSGPGQTIGVSVFVDPMIQTLELTRSQVSGAYLVGTLTGAVAQPRIGRFIDDLGARVTMLAVGGVFGVVLAAMAGVTGLITLVIGFTGIRMLGQGGLTLVATTSVAPWFERRRGTAVGVTTAAGSAMFSLVPFVAAFVIDRLGWRVAWLAMGALVWLVVLPLALRGMIDHPVHVGQIADGHRTPTSRRGGAHAHGPLEAVPTGRRASGATEPAFTRAQAMRTSMFWAIASAAATTALIATGLAFHQIDLLGEQGLTPIEAAANFVPQMLAALGATLLVGAMVDRFAPRWVLLASMGLLAGAMLAVPHVTPGGRAVAYGIAVGAAGAAARRLEAAAFPKLFGIRHLGSIRGVVTAVAVAASAFGPLALAIGHDLTGSYVPVLHVLLVLPIATSALAVVAPMPRMPVDGPTLASGRSG